MKDYTRPQKILFVITKSNFGGAQKYVYELTKELQKDKNYDVTVAFGGNGVLADYLKEAGIKTQRLYTFENNFSLLSVFSNLKELKTLIKKERPDIIHLNSSKAGYFGAVCGRLYSDSKIIFTSHGWPYNEDRPFLVRLFLWKLMAITVLLSHKVIAVSEKIKEETPLYFLVKNKIKRIYFGITSFELLSREEAREILAIDSHPNRIEIVTIAELNKNKGYQYALLAMRNLIHNEKAPIHYHILGGGEDEDKIKALIRKYHLELYVTMHGFVKDVAKYMRAFDIFLLTSITEALGYVLLEAGYANLGVVATNVGGVPEVIKNGKTGLLAESKNSREIKEKLSLIIKDSDLRKKLADNLHEEVINEFSFTQTMEKTKKLYQEVLE